MFNANNLSFCLRYYDSSTVHTRIRRNSFRLNRSILLSLFIPCPDVGPYETLGLHIDPFCFIARHVSISGHTRCDF